MILLRHDCLVFKTSDGDSIPCSAEQVTLEIIGDAIAQLDEQTVKQASAAVLHYFKAELGKTSVTVGEFSTALEHALRSLGLKVQSASAITPPPTPRVVRSDLSHLANESDQGFELVFFPRLRSAMQQGLDQAPDVVHFRGLRPCVKRLLGARRWTQGCQSLNDQIVDYLRTCFDAERRAASCALVVC